MEKLDSAASNASSVVSDEYGSSPMNDVLRRLDLGDLLRDELTLNRPSDTRKTWGYFSNNFYEILHHGDTVGYVQEKTPTFDRLFYKSFRPYVMDVYNSQHEMLFTVAKPKISSKFVIVSITCVDDIVTIGKCKLTGKINHRFYQVEVNSRRNIEISPNCKASEFQINDSHNSVGVIHKQTHSFGNRIFHNDNVYSIDFVGGDIAQKIMVIAATLMIDLDFSAR